MSAVLLTEDGARILTENGLHHLLIEPISPDFPFPSRFGGVAHIIDKGTFWEVNLGSGPIKSKFPNELEHIARKAGAASVVYE